MAETNNDKLFRTKVLPIMNKVMRDLRLKQSEEMAIHTSSLPYIMAGAAGPDGGMSAQAVSLPLSDTRESGTPNILKTTFRWSKMS